LDKLPETSVITFLPQRYYKIPNNPYIMARGPRFAGAFCCNHEDAGIFTIPCGKFSSGLHLFVTKVGYTIIVPEEEPDIKGN
jgi:hypothetical protein